MAKKGARPSPVARDLRTPKYRKRVVRSKRAYTRKGRVKENIPVDV